MTIKKTYDCFTWLCSTILHLLLLGYSGKFPNLDSYIPFIQSSGKAEFF